MNTRNVRILIRSLFCALAIGALPATSFGAVVVGVSINIAPPVLPVYVQPPCPAPGYLWTPGYWAYGSYGYYWVPGVWVQPPRYGVLWTPGYWGYDGGYYVWHAGYWGPHVGFYGGVHYGFGYNGIGFVGGVWAGPVFRYNTAVVNVNRTVIHNTYIDRTVIHNTTVINRTSFNGPGGMRAVPTARERETMHEAHYQRTTEQQAHRTAARDNPGQRFSDNRGTPHATAMNRINGRRYNQQGRIANGVASGQLTPGETRNLETREAHLNRSIHADRRANGGAPTPHEREQINRRQNHVSRDIARHKHNERHEPR